MVGQAAISTVMLMLVAHGQFAAAFRQAEPPHAIGHQLSDQPGTVRDQALSALQAEVGQQAELKLTSKMKGSTIGILIALALCGCFCCAGTCHAICTTKDGQGTCNEISSLLISYFIPPLGIYWRFGCGIHFFLCCLLTLCGYFPGVIFAFAFIIFKPTDDPPVA